MHFWWLKLRFFLHLDETLDTFKTTKEDHAVLEVCPLLKVLEVNDVSFVWGTKLEIVATLVRTLTEDIFESLCHADRVSPISTLLQEWLFLTHNLSSVVSNAVWEASLVKFDSDSGAFLQV